MATTHSCRSQNRSRPVQTIEGVSGLKRVVGTELGVSPWFAIGQEQIDAFADVTGDHQWIHVDTERAAASRFRATVAHGLLTLSLIPHLSRQAYTITGVDMTVNYGFNRVRFPNAVSPGARVRDRATLLTVTPTSAGVQVLIEHSIEVEGEAKPACVAETITLLTSAVDR